MSNSTDLYEDRPRITKRLRLEITKDICENPGMSAREIIERAIKRNIRDVIYFYSKKVVGTLTFAQQLEITNASTKKEAKQLYDLYLIGTPDTYELNLAVVNRVKKWHNQIYIKNNDSAMPIYGAVGMGYVSEDKMDEKTAARWLYPRLKQTQHESLHTATCTRIIEQGAKTKLKKDVAKKLREWVNKATDYNELKLITSGLKVNYLTEQ